MFWDNSRKNPYGKKGKLHKNFFHRIQKQMVLHPDLFEIISELAWGVKMNYECLQSQLECAIDIRKNVPEWFLQPIIIRDDPKNNPRLLVRRKNPLIFGHPFIPIINSDLIYDRNVILLVNHINAAFWRRSNQYKSTVWKLVRRPVTQTWNQFIERMDGLAPTDIHTEGCLMRSLILTMIDQLHQSNLICRWKLALI